MCESQEKEGLPMLPGLSFQDPTKVKFHKNQFCNIQQGFMALRQYAPGTGQYPRDIDSVRYLDVESDAIIYDPSLTYGRSREYAIPSFKPHWVTYDKKCLTFKAFFKEAVFNSPDEYYRIRAVNMIYFLDDDTLTVIEPQVDNCGFPQGRLVRRGKVPKYGYEDGVYLHWKDFNLGMDVAIAGIVYHVIDCDLFTKEFLLCQGVELNDPECMPPDPYIQTRLYKTRTPSRKTPIVDDRLRRFLEFDGKILRFRAVWDDRDSEHGEMGSYVISYYLEDDTVEVLEIHEANDGKDPFPKLLTRSRLPKNWKDVPVTYPSIYLERSEADVTEYYQPKDFIIGQTIFVFGRRMLLHKCDQKTRNYYCKALNIKQPPDFEVFDKPKARHPEPPPPHIGIGTLEDSLASCMHFIPKAPKKDIIKLIVNAGKCLRYSAKLKTTHPEDENREFVIFYSLADSMIKILEPRLRNSGHMGGKFLSSMLVPKPGSHPDFPEYYSPSDFYIGAIVVINNHKFLITGADLQVYRYMEANPEKFRSEVVDTLRNYLAKLGLLKDDIGTVAKAILKPEESDSTKDCVPESEANPSYDKADPCTEKTNAQLPQPCAPEEIIPESCNNCPLPLDCGKVPPECKTEIPEAHLSDFTGRMVLNRNNPHWK